MFFIVPCFYLNWPTCINFFVLVKMCNSNKVHIKIRSYLFFIWDLFIYILIFIYYQTIYQALRFHFVCWKWLRVHVRRCHREKFCKFFFGLDTSHSFDKLIEGKKLTQFLVISSWIPFTVLFNIDGLPKFLDLFPCKIYSSITLAE